MDVRRATVADRAAIGDRLALAFADDPVMRVLFPTAARNRHARLATFLGLGVAGALRNGEVWTASDRAASAVWRAPGCWRLRGSDALAAILPSARALGRGVLPGLAMLRAIERHHPTEPHWYLEILGTAPAYQGKGLGSGVLTPVLERCDAEGLGAYLESSKEQNVPYYRRHGFEVTGELPLAGGARVWPMWRDPR